MNKFKLFLLLGVFIVTLTACEDNTPVDNTPLSYTVEQSTTPVCSYNTAEYTDDEVQIISVSSENNDIFGDITKFSDSCKTSEINPLVFANAKLKSYFIVVELDAVYPVKNIEITNFLSDDEMAVKEIDLAISLDGESYTKVYDDEILSNTGNKRSVLPLDDQMVRYIKISFRNESNVGNHGSEFFGLNDISVFLGEGFIVREASEWDAALTRYEGWTGADGIFTFNLQDGNDSINTQTPSTLFIFSDTILGSVNPQTFLRLNPEFLNNTIGYYNGDDSDIFNNMEFEWLEEDSLPANIFEPDEYVGYHPSNLSNQIGLSLNENTAITYDYSVSGSSWLSSDEDQTPTVLFDFLEETTLSKMELYNFVENLDFSTTQIKVSHSNDNTVYTDIGTYNVSVPTMSTSLSPSTIGDDTELDLTGTTARYIKIELLDNNSDASNQVGLSKVRFFNSTDTLYSIVTASSYDDTDKEVMEHPRLWLQDGVVIGEYFYTFPLLVKDYETFFKVFKVGLIKVRIVDGKLDISSTEYIDTPLQHSGSDGSITYFGAGVNNMDSSGHLSNQDGYIYVYGYKDVNGGRFLTVARVEEEHFENFNRWTYYDGSTWSNNIDDCAPLLNGVSPELSVTYMNSGSNQGKYMLVAMKNTTSGTIVISYSDNPYGPWSDFETVYLATEIRSLPGGFAYNAKMHPHLSEQGKYLVSYNVNTTGLSVMSNAEIYHPRFIWMIETKNR